MWPLVAASACVALQLLAFKVHGAVLLDVLPLAVLTVYTAVLEACNLLPGASYITRSSPHQGLALGLLGLPSLTSACALLSHSGAWQLLQLSCAEGSLLLLLYLLWQDNAGSVNSTESTGSMGSKRHTGSEKHASHNNQAMSFGKSQQLQHHQPASQHYVTPATNGTNRVAPKHVSKANGSSIMNGNHHHTSNSQESLRAVDATVKCNGTRNHAMQHLCDGLASSSSGSSSCTSNGWRTWCLLAAACIATLLLLQLRPSTYQSYATEHSNLHNVLPSLSAVLLVTLSGFGPVVLYGWLMQQLPGSFTLGEGVVVTQGLCLLVAGSCSHLAQHIQQHGHVFMATLFANTATATATGWACQGGGAADVSTFVLLLPFWMMMLAAGAWALLQYPAAGSAATAAAAAGAADKRPLHMKALALQLQRQQQRRQQCRLQQQHLRSQRRQPAAWWQRPPAWALPAAGAAALAVALAAIADLAAWVLLVFLPALLWPRLALLAFWLLLLCASLPAMYCTLHWVPQHSRVPHIILRKGYHGLALALFVPAMLWDFDMLQVSLAIAFAAMVFSEVLRCSGMPVVSKAIQSFMHGFADERDAGPIYATHIALLLGIAVPMWLAGLCQGTGSFAPSGRPAAVAPGSATATATAVEAAAAVGIGMGGQQVGSGPDVAGAGTLLACGQQAGIDACKLILAMSGLLCLGIGDTAASTVGYLYGRVRIHNGSKKTLEGLVAGIAAMLVSGWCCIMLAEMVGPRPSPQAGGDMPGWVASSGLGWSMYREGQWGGLVSKDHPQLLLWVSVATCCAGLLEALTYQLDNLVVPVYYLAHLMLCFSV